MAGLLHTCCPGVFQRVRHTHRLTSLGGTSHPGLVDGTNPELVQTPFLEPKHWVVAHFLNVRVATHPLILTDIISEKELAEERGREKKNLLRTQRKTFILIAHDAPSVGCSHCKASQFVDVTSKLVNAPSRVIIAPWDYYFNL